MKTLEIFGPTLSNSGPDGVARTRSSRFLGSDIGAETLKLVEVLKDGDSCKIVRQEILEHDKKPGGELIDMLQRSGWSTAGGATVTGHLSTQINLPRVPA